MRGQFAAGFDLAGGTSAVVLERSVMLGGPGPLVRIVDSEAAVDRRLYFSESIVAGPGPIIQWSRKESGPQTKPLLVRSFGSVFGRFHGDGVATVISSSSSVDAAAKQVDWEGDNNLFAGWKGFFASGTTQRSPSPTSPRSVPRGTRPNERVERFSYHGLTRSIWQGRRRQSIRPFVPTGEMILQQVARPRAGIFEKAIGGIHVSRDASADELGCGPHEPDAEKRTAGNRDRGSACCRGVFDPGGDRGLRPAPQADVWPNPGSDVRHRRPSPGAATSGPFCGTD